MTMTLERVDALLDEVAADRAERLAEKRSAAYYGSANLSALMSASPYHRRLYADGGRIAKVIPYVPTDLDVERDDPWMKGREGAQACGTCWQVPSVNGECAC